MYSYHTGVNKTLLLSYTTHYLTWTLSYLFYIYKPGSDPLDCLSQFSWCRWAAPPSQRPVTSPPLRRCAQSALQCPRQQRRRWKGSHKVFWCNAAGWQPLGKGHSRTPLQRMMHFLFNTLHIYVTQRQKQKEIGITDSTLMTHVGGQNSPPLFSWGVGSTTCQPSKPTPRSGLFIQHSTHTWKFLHEETQVLVHM